jgi:hypothetical protein
MPSITQKKIFTSQVGTTIGPFAFDNPVTAGACIAVAEADLTPGVTITSITDNLGNSGYASIRQFSDSGGRTSRLWAVFGVAAGATSITINHSGSTNTDVAILELDAASVLTSVGAQSGNTQVHQASNVANVAAAALFLQICSLNVGFSGDTATPGDGYTSETQSNQIYIQSKQVASVETNDGSFTTSNFKRIAHVLAVFEGVGSGAPGVGCKQVFFSRDTGNIGTGLIFKPPFAGQYSTNLTWGASTAANATQKVLIDCTITNLTVSLAAAPGVGSSRTFTLYLNGVATALSFTIADAATSGSSTAVVNCVAGDLVYLQCSVTGTPTNTQTRVAFELNGANAYETMYGGAGALASLTTQYYCPLFSNGVGIDGGSAFVNTSVVSAPGTITDLDVMLTIAPGGATSRTFTILKNGVMQDGSGGTPDTRVVLTGSSLAGSSSFSLAVAAGDEVRLTQTASGPPAATVCSFSVKVDSTTDGYSNLCGFNANFLPGTTAYSIPVVAGSWGATESAELLIGPLSTIILKNFHARSGSAVTNQTYTTRKNSANTSIAANLTAATSGSDLVNTATLGSGDVWSLQCAGDGGFLRTLCWAWTIHAVSDYVPGNVAPVANAGPDNSVVVNQQVALAGSATDADLDALTYLWTVLSGPGTATFVDATDPLSLVSFDTVGSYELQLEVDDGTDTDTDTMTMTVVIPPLLVNAGPDVTITLPATLTLCGSHSYGTTP